MSTSDRPGTTATPVKRLDEASHALEALQGVLAGEEPIERVLQRLVDSVVRVFVDATAVSVTIVSDEQARTAAATDELVVAIDADQYAAGDGPCLEAARTGKPLRVQVIEARERWPEFTAAAEKAGVHAYLSAPLLVDNEDGELVGALNVYSDEPHGFDPFDEALLRLFTTAASAAIINARRHVRSRKLTHHLERALTSRAEIDQAKGVLMAVYGIDAEQAFQRLMTQSQNTNTKLHDVARRLLASLRDQ